MNYKKKFFLIITMLLLMGCSGDDKKMKTDTDEVSATVENAEVKDEVINTKERTKIDNLPAELQDDAKKVKKVKTKVDAHNSKIDDIIQKSEKM
ncbi:MAG: hypothetical protein GY760_24075, partial [Deltaproteobacteria bacterium]|nr:hypothetical protein [Deltaproteobacteria bacterium]